MANTHPLTQYRQKHGLTQEGLARQIGTTKASISRWEAGKRRPRHGQLVKLFESTGISPRRLIGIELQEIER